VDIPGKLKDESSEKQPFILRTEMWIFFYLELSGVSHTSKPVYACGLDIFTRKSKIWLFIRMEDPHRRLQQQTRVKEEKEKEKERTK
jgi:hypothetical protein